MESRQVRRAKERRSKKPVPASIERTSMRWIGRTKGQPYSRQKLLRVIAAKPGAPARFVTASHTRGGAANTIIATAANIDWFFPSLPDNMRAALLGQF